MARKPGIAKRAPRSSKVVPITPRELRTLKQAFWGDVNTPRELRQLPHPEPKPEPNWLDRLLGFFGLRRA